MKLQRQLFPCDLTNGRLLADCKEGMAGIKTLHFAKFNDVIPTLDVNGCVDDIGTLSVYRYELPTNLGEAAETPTSTPESGVAYFEQLVTLAILSIACADLPDLNALNKGRWVIFAQYQNNDTRAFGLYNSMSSNGGASTSGIAPGDAKSFSLTFAGRENDLAPFLLPPAVPDALYNPWKDMVTVTVVPTY